MSLYKIKKAYHSTKGKLNNLFDLRSSPSHTQGLTSHNSPNVSLVLPKYIHSTESAKKLASGQTSSKTKKSSFNNGTRETKITHRDFLSKSLVSKTAISKGQLITWAMISTKKSEHGLPASKLEYLIGRIASRNIDEGDYFLQSDIDSDIVKTQNHDLDRPFATPAHHHDYKKLKGAKL